MWPNAFGSFSDRASPLPSIEIVLYNASFADAWNRLVASARNGHFLFNRRYMEYNAKRFQDASLMFLEKNHLIGLLPAHREGATLYSHRGLTFGGIVAADNLGAGRVLGVFSALRRFLAAEGIDTLVYKAMPHIYHRRPSEEDLYALFRGGADLIRRDVATTIDYACPGRLTHSRRKGGRKAKAAGLTFGESDRWMEYWDLLISVLAERHGVRPVHSLAEILRLRADFPEAIRLFAASSPAGALLAGAVIFETETVAHVQYGTVSREGRAAWALDGLYLFLIDHYRASKRWFDFGISTQCNGQVLNEGLAQQKEECGGSGVVYDTYRLRIA